MSTDQAIEQEIQAKGLTAARITLDHINTLMDTVTTRTHHFPGTTSTVAIAVLPNGFVVAVGHSACASPENFNADIGAKIAIGNALAQCREKLWELEGYALKQRLAGL